MSMSWGGNADVRTMCLYSGMTTRDLALQAASFVSKRIGLPFPGQVGSVKRPKPVLCLFFRGLPRNRCVLQQAFCSRRLVN